MNSTTIPAEQAPSGASFTEAPQRFADLRRRARTGIFVEAFGLLAVLSIAFAIPSLLTDRLLRLELVYRAVLLASFVAVVARVIQRRLLRPLAVELTDEEMALAVERQEPGVKQALISSLQFDRDLRAGVDDESPAMKAAVIASTRSQLAAIPFARAIDVARVRRFAAGIAAAALFFGGWAGLHSGSLRIWAHRNVLLGSVEWPRFTALSFAGIENGNVRLPQGDALTLRVLAQGEVPEQVFVEYEFATGDRGEEPMSRTGDAEFTWTMDAVLSDARLALQGGDSLPVELRIEVVERPRIEDLAVQVTFPDYMERDVLDVPATEGELKLPRGAVLRVAGRSHKAIDEAFLLFRDEAKVQLDRDADGFGFHGGFSPETSGLLVVDVVDRDRLGTGAPPKLLLRVGEDKGPQLDFRLRGIGSTITTHARIPGELKVKDDFGVRRVSASMRAVRDSVEDRAPGEDAAPPPEVPVEPATAVFGEPLPRSATRYDTEASVDLAQWNKVPDENSPANRVRPGMLLSLRFGATDNFGPGEPHEGFTETMTFRIVTRETLLEELRRRQVEQRNELQRILDEERAALGELREIVNPQQAAERRGLAESRLKTLARLQQSLGRRTAFVGETYQRILWEYENNRLIEARQVREIERAITVPLAAVAKEAFPATSRLVGSFAGTGAEETRAEAVDGYMEIERRLIAVLQQMEQAESLAAILEDLRIVIKGQSSAIEDVERRVEEREKDIFGPKTDTKDGK
jgi:hypothetical protein